MTLPKIIMLSVGISLIAFSCSAFNCAFAIDSSPQKTDIHGLRIGMSADEVENLVGPCAEVSYLNRNFNQVAYRGLECRRGLYLVKFTYPELGEKAYEIWFDFKSDSSQPEVIQSVEEQYSVSSPEKQDDKYVWQLHNGNLLILRSFIMSINYELGLYDWAMHNEHLAFENSEVERLKNERTKPPPEF